MREPVAGAYEREDISQAMSYWRKGMQYVEELPEFLSEAYLKASTAGVQYLAFCQTSTELLDEYYLAQIVPIFTPSQLVWLGAACKSAGYSLREDVVEDVAFYLRMQELVMEVQNM